MINVALLGAGYWGSNLCRVLAQSKRFNLKWVSDLNPATLERARRLAPMARVTTDPSAPLSDPAVSAVRRPLTMHLSPNEVLVNLDVEFNRDTSSDDHAAATLSLVEECGLTYLHVFPFSSRPGTPAARMPPGSAP